MMLLAALVVLHPVLAEDQPVRLAASASAEQVTWTIDGEPLGTYPASQAVRVELKAGEHWVKAESPSRAEWTALVRPDPDHGPGASLVQAWSATAPATPRSGPSSGIVPIALAALGVAILAWPHVPRRRGPAMAG